MDGIDGNTFTIILMVVAVSLGLYYFQSRQIAAVDKRLRDDMSDLRDEISDLRSEITASETRLRGEITATEDRLRDEIIASETRLRGEITATEDRLRGEIMASEARLRGEITTTEDRLENSIEATNRRIDETNAEIRILINDVGVLKGALGVSTQSREREPVRTE